MRSREGVMYKQQYVANPLVNRGNGIFRGGAIATLVKDGVKDAFALVSGHGAVCLSPQRGTPKEARIGGFGGVESVTRPERKTGRP